MHEGNNCRGCVEGNIMKILFITLSNIGDAVLTLPLFSALKDKFPKAKIDIMAAPRSKEVFAKDPKVNRIFIYDKHSSLAQKMKFIGMLRKEKYDLCVDMKTSLMPILIDAKKMNSLFLINKSRKKHKKLHHLDKLKSLGIEYKIQRNVYIDEEDKKTLSKLLKGGGFRDDDILVGIAPSCRSYTKEWLADGFVEVVNNLLEDKRCKVILMGEASQINSSNAIKNAVKHEGLLDLTGKLTLNELFALIDRLGVLLTCDSASMHIASDLGVKVAAIFGPTDHEEYGPTGPRDIVIRKDLKCSPCKKSLCKYNHECMKQIKPQEVIEAVKKLL